MFDAFNASPWNLRTTLISREHACMTFLPMVLARINVTVCSVELHLPLIRFKHSLELLTDLPCSSVPWNVVIAAVKRAQVAENVHEDFIIKSQPILV